MSETIKNILKIASVLLLFGLILYLFPSYTTSYRYHVEVGKPWGYGLITADRDFPIYKSEQQLADERAELLKTFAPCFRPDSGMRRVPEPAVVTYADYERLTEAGITRISVLTGRVSTPLPLERVYTPKSAYLAFSKDYVPNLTYDSITSSRLKDNLLSQIAPTQGMVQAGEKIIDRGEIITERDYQILQSHRRSMEEHQFSTTQRITRAGGTAILVSLFLLLFILYLYIYRRDVLQSLSASWFFTLLVAMMVLGAFIWMRFLHWSVYLLPFAWVPVLVRVFYDSRTALFLHMVVVFIVALAMPTPYEFLIIQMVGGIAALLSLTDLTKRAQLVHTATWIFLAYSLTYTAVILHGTGDVASLNWHFYAYFLVNGVLVVCAYGLIYLFERTFGLLSSITLVELSDINSDLLHDLAEHAPGTFQHSMQVSSLATEAAKAIGANAILVRTAALYHDIGKLLHPEFFTENQDTVNPLASLPPKQAAALIINHVEDGVHLAEKHHLPPMVSHFIRTHHGTSMARYFYNTAINNGEKVNPKDFQYPGPKPSTREGAILMMADAVEARSHSLTDYTPQTLAESVDKMIDAQIADGQFADTPLSFRDIETVRAVFKQRLATIYHHRIQYPEVKKQE